MVWVILVFLVVYVFSAMEMSYAMSEIDEYGYGSVLMVLCPVLNTIGTIKYLKKRHIFKNVNNDVKNIMKKL